MKREDLKDKRPIKVNRNELKYKGCLISYTVSDYGAGSSAVARIFFDTITAFAIVSIILEEPTEKFEDAETKIIEKCKNWIDTYLRVPGDNK